MAIVYKIQRMSDGLFSTGGMKPTFSKKGKTWQHRGHVTSHLSQLSVKERQETYGNCRAVEFELIETEKNSVNVLDWKEDPKTTRAKELEAERREKEKSTSKDREIARLREKLKKLTTM